VSDPSYFDEDLEIRRTEEMFRMKFEMKPETIRAIVSTRDQIGSLGKSAMNPHGRYKYVSIDTYYEKVGSVAAKHGLSWVVREVDFELLPEVGKTGIIQATYSITLMHISGDVVPDFTRITIVHPLQGAQTVGSAMSYLDKVFMRQLFAIATGEKDSDADETDPNELLGGSTPSRAREPERRLEPKQEPEKPEMSVADIEAMFTSFLPMAQDEEELKAFWSDNYPARNTLKDSDDAAYKRVLAAFSARKAQIKNS
jgi:hypothetical protein